VSSFSNDWKLIKSLVASNRVEFKKLNVTKRFLDFLAIENNNSLFALALTSFSPYLEDCKFDHDVLRKK
jgi:hypothetical protein